MEESHVTASDVARAAARIAAAFAREPAVVAVAWGGSWTTGAAGSGSDIDLYVYADPEVSVAVRAGIASRFAEPGSEVELDNRFWETGDEWRDAESGLWIDLMFRSPAWAEDQLARVLDRHEASIGYTTSIWHNVRTSRALVDREGWFGRLQRSAERPYPEDLRRAIVEKNHPILGAIHSSYRAQIAKAIDRADLVSVNHRTAAFLASYFDILFALNRVPHPGEKRVMEHAEALCPVRPARLRDQIQALLTSPGPGILAEIDALIVELDRLLAEDGLAA